MGEKKKDIKIGSDTKCPGPSGKSHPGEPLELVFGVKRSGVHILAPYLVSCVFLASDNVLSGRMSLASTGELGIASPPVFRAGLELC